MKTLLKTLLILTGPQGSGNHMWSKIFALHADVLGWQALLDQYWIGHDQEPFAEYWQCPERLNEFDWSQADYYVTGISVPYALNGTLTVPNFDRFVAAVQSQGVQVKIAILGRDQNIVGLQQARVREQQTFNQALAAYNSIRADCYLSYELLHLYRSRYLESVSQQLNFPVDYNNPAVENIIGVDTNSKYFCAVDSQPTDDLARHASRKWR
jgi:hypothetical protein